MTTLAARFDRPPEAQRVVRDTTAADEIARRLDRIRAAQESLARPREERAS